MADKVFANLNPTNNVVEVATNRVLQEFVPSDKREMLTRAQVAQVIAAQIGGLFATEVGGVPERVSVPGFTDFLRSDVHILGKLARHEVAKYTKGSSVLELVKHRDRWLYQVAEVLTATTFADTILEDVTLVSQGATLPANSIHGYPLKIRLATHYELKDDGFVYVERIAYNVTKPDAYEPADRLLTADERARLAEKYKVGIAERLPAEIREIPVVLEFPFIDDASLLEKIPEEITTIWLAYVALFSRLTISKHSYAINTERLSQSNAHAKALKAKLAVPNGEIGALVEVPATGGALGDVLVPMSVQPDFRDLQQAVAEAIKQALSRVNAPDYSPSSSGVTNKQDKEIAAGVLNKTNIVEVVKEKRERYWAQTARNWALLTGSGTPPELKDVEVELVTTDFGDIAGLNNINQNVAQEKVEPAVDAAAKEGLDNVAK